MSLVTAEISISLDGFVAGPNPTLEEPLGEGGERLHDWIVATQPWREAHGLSGGETGIDAELMAESIAKVGATVMGRRMFSGGTGSWAEDPKADGWWGDDPPFHHPVFVLTHHERDPVVKKGGTTFTFVTAGIEAALEQAIASAGDKNVAVAGGANAIQQYLNAGLIDELQIHVAPVLLGGGVRLFDDVRKAPFGLEYAGVIASSSTAHLRLRVPN
jgi:dihydrofolate reductase